MEERSVETVWKTMERLHSLHMACLAVCAVCLILCVFLFFRFRIRRIFNDLTGRSVRKAVKQMQKRNAETAPLRAGRTGDGGGIFPRRQEESL